MISYQFTTRRNAEQVRSGTKLRHCSLKNLSLYPAAAPDSVQNVPYLINHRFPVPALQNILPNHPTIRGVNHNKFIHPSLNDHRDVVNSFPIPLEKHQVSRTGSIDGNRSALLSLIARNAVDVDARVLVQIEHEAGAIEALTRIIATVFIPKPHQFFGVTYDVRTDVRRCAPRATRAGTHSPRTNDISGISRLE